MHNFSRPWERARGIGCAQGAAHSTCANLIVDDGQAQPCCRRACLWLTAAVVVIVSHFSLIRQTLSIRSSKRPASKPTKGGSNLMPSGDCAATVPRPELEYEVPIATRLFLGWFLGCPEFTVKPTGAVGPSVVAIHWTRSARGDDPTRKPEAKRNGDPARRG